jgi:hypothetical protein
MTEFTSINSSDLLIINESHLSDNEENSSSEEMFNEINCEKINNIINKLFNNKSLPLDEDNIKYYDAYFYPNKKKSDLFIVTESTTQLTKKKRGKHSNLNKNNKKTHNRFSIDNLLIKIKNHSLSLVAPFLNDILKKLSIKEEFYQLSHKFKKNIKNNYFSEEKKKTLGEIICNKISPKYKHDENENQRIFGKVKNHEIFKKILNMDYITFFRRYYMESKKCINLKDYGLENEVNLSEKCKMFNDLIKKIKNSNNEDNENYIKSIKKCINKNYIAKKLFKTSK